MTTPTQTPNNLPLALSSFIGRAAEVSSIKQLVLTNRLVSLTGTGGIGKSRLALQTATELLTVFDEGVWWVDLTPINNPVLVTQRVTNALGLIEPSNQDFVDLLVEFLRDKSTLLILENCEHVLEACVALAEKLLGHCPNLHLLTTSQAALNITGEHNWLVPALSFPTNATNEAKEMLNFDAAKLFIERARAVDNKFAITSHNAQAIVQICQRLDGHPLAIELAAARSSILTPEQIAVRLDKALDLLNRGTQSAPQRHRSLRATLDWSYDLLSDPERIFFRRLSIFENGFTLEAAEAVCGERGLENNQILELLDGLRAKSLLLKNDQDSQARYRLLEPIRQYARQLLTASQEIEWTRERHATFFIEWVKTNALKTYTGEQKIWLNAFAREVDNIRRALEWAVVNDPLSGLHLVEALTSFWNARGHATEGRRWGETFLRISAATEFPAIIKAQARAMVTVAFLAMTQGENQLANQMLVPAIAILREQNDSLGLIRALFVYASDLTFLGQWERSQSAAEEALALGDELQDFLSRPGLLGILAQLMFRKGENAKGQRLLEQSVASSHQNGSYTAIGLAHWAAGNLASLQKDLPRAQEHFNICLKHFQELDDKHRINMVSSSLAGVLRQMGKHEQAKKLYLEIIQGWRDYGQMGGIARCVECLAFIALAEKRALFATRWLGSAEALREAAQAQMIPAEQAEHAQALNTLRQSLNETEFERSWSQGRAMPLNQTIAEIEQVALTPLASSPSPAASRAQTGELTIREHEVLRLLAQGLSDTQIAEKLVISRRTVTTHLTTIYSKFGVKSRSAAIRQALDKQLV